MARSAHQPRGALGTDAVPYLYAALARHLQQHGLTLDEGQLHAIVRLALEPVPELAGKIPLVMYFESDAEVEEFVRLVRAAKPNFTARKC